MGYLFSRASIFLTAMVGGVGILLGGYDDMVTVFLSLLIIDYITGLMGAIYNRELNSGTGFKGIIKKILIIFTVGVAVKLNMLFPDVPLREIVLSFYIANEGISFCENICKFIPVPESLKAFFEQLREKEN